MQENPNQGCVFNPSINNVPYSGPGAGTIPSFSCLAQIVTNVINLAFAFLGFVTVLFLIFGSIKFVISRGDQKALQGAKNTITYAIIAAVLLLLSYAIISFVTNILGLPSILSNFTLYQK